MSVNDFRATRDHIGDSFKAFPAAAQYLKSSDKLFWQKLYFFVPHTNTSAIVGASAARFNVDLVGIIYV